MAGIRSAYVDHAELVIWHACQEDLGTGQESGVGSVLFSWWTTSSRRRVPHQPATAQQAGRYGHTNRGACQNTNVNPLRTNRFADLTNGDAVSGEDQGAGKPPPNVVYGYLRVIRSDVGRAEGLRTELAAFCMANGLMLNIIFTDWGVEDTAIARPGFTSLLDVCQLVGSYGVVVLTRAHLSVHQPTLELLTLQIKRTATKLIAVDEFERDKAAQSKDANSIEAMADREEP
jgi:hypothetical protein